MTRRTICQTLNFVFFHELCAKFDLIRRYLIIWIEDFRFRAHIFCRLAVAIQAPGHVESLGAPRQRHLRDLAMARRAANALGDVDAVVEINEVGHGIHTRPRNGDIIAITCVHRREHRGVRPNLRMAHHASLRRRHARERGLFHRCVAIATIDSKFARMMLMAERNGLLARYIHIGVPRRHSDLVKHAAKQSNNEDAAVNAQPRDRVRAVMKDLRHSALQVFFIYPNALPAFPLRASASRKSRSLARIE